MWAPDSPGLSPNYRPRPDMRSDSQIPITLIKCSNTRRRSRRTGPTNPRTKRELRHNNSATIWHIHGDSTDSGRALPDYRVEVSVDDRHPSAGDTVNYTVSVVSEPVPDDLWKFGAGCVNIKLTDGLTKGTATFDPATDHSFADSTTRECGDTGDADGFFLLPDVKNTLRSTMTLPVTVDSNATVTEQCLTAEVFAVPPTGPGRYLDDPHDNRVEVCLDYPPPEVFDDGEVRTWTLFACKDGVDANMCDMADEVDVRVVASVLVEAGDHGDPDTIRTFDYSTALIHVQDEPARVFDAHTGSITNASTVSWQTATDAHMDYTGTRTGVKTGLYTAPVNDYIDNWTNHHPTFRSSGLDGGDPPGNIHVRSSPNGNAFWLLTSTTSYTAKLASAFPLTSTSNAVTQLFLDFDQIGTYVVDYDVDMLHASIDVDGETGPDTFSGTGRTIFHVGPLAELGVGDGGVSPDATADQVAFTVVGFNDTGDTYESGEIVVVLPAGTTGLTTVPASTGVFDGTASPPTWTWDIYDLEQTGDIRASEGLPPGIIVTLIVDGVTAATITGRKQRPASNMTPTRCASPTTAAPWRIPTTLTVSLTRPLRTSGTPRSASTPQTTRSIRRTPHKLRATPKRIASGLKTSAPQAATMSRPGLLRRHATAGSRARCTTTTTTTTPPR